MTRHALRSLLSACGLLAVAACMADGPSRGASAPSIAPAAAPPPLTATLASQSPAKALFGAAPAGSTGPSRVYGSYAKGCVAGAVQLPETGPTWQAMRLSRNRNWAHPTTVDFLQDLSRRAATLPGWEGIYVGDMSQPRGGPMTSGHASHQSGLDADIWLRRTDRLNLSRQEREDISSTSLRRAEGAYTNDQWTRQHHELVRMAAQDPRVSRIFLFPGAKVRMCEEETGDRAWLRKVRPWWGHHYHFHVRLSCPAGSPGCENQSPPPPGDGCDDARQWVRNILNPPAPDPNAPAPTRRRDLTLADLPQACSALVN